MNEEPTGEGLACDESYRADKPSLGTRKEHYESVRRGEGRGREGREKRVARFVGEQSPHWLCLVLHSITSINPRLPVGLVSIIYSTSSMVDYRSSINVNKRDLQLFKTCLL